MVSIDERQVRRLAGIISQLPDVKPLDFYHTFDGTAHDSDMYPELNHPLAVHFFFLACLHNYGFWYSNEQGYVAPMYIHLEGKMYKGSDAMWRVLKRAFDNNPQRFLPANLATLTPARWTSEPLFEVDGLPLRFPNQQERLELTRAFGHACLEHLPSPDEFVTGLSYQARPLKKFLSTVSNLAGFDQDPFQKKARLLAMALMNRPERFLKPASNEKLGPIVDYHLMRLALRLGLVRLTGQEALIRNTERTWVSPRSESDLRRATHNALAGILELSGVSPDKLDYAMWSARRYCPEMEEPNCAKCQFQAICRKHTELFQPVFRTTAY